MTKTHRMMALAGALFLATACGGGAEAPEPEVPEVPEVPSVDEGMPELECPEEAMYSAVQTSQGIEQACDIAGVRHGPFRLWFDKSTKSVEGEYDMGQPNGTWVWRFENGAKKSKGSYKGGKQVGGWTWWHENGNVAEEGDFLKGRKAGQWTLKYDNGAAQEGGMYHNGEKNGKWSYHRNDADNTLARVEQWTGGTLSKTEYYAVDGTKSDKPPEGEQTAEDAASDK